MTYTENEYIQAGRRYEAAGTVDAARARAEVLRRMLERESVDDQGEARRLIEQGRQEARQGGGGMSIKQTPIRPEGWRFAGSSGDFKVWHVGKNDYRITDGALGDVAAREDQFGTAHSLARRADDVRRSEHVTAHYTDRANGAHAAKAP